MKPFDPSVQSNQRFIDSYLNRFVPQGQLLAFKEKRAFSCELDMTLRCKAGCHYCYAGSTAETIDQISSEKIYQILDDLSELGIRLVLWEGGEPFLRSNWRKIITYARILGLHSHVLTSGAPLSDQNVARDALNIADSIQIHLDTVSEKDFMSVRTTDNIFYHQVRKGIENLISFGASNRITICLKILRQNVDTICKTIDWIIDDLGLPGESIIIGPYTPFCGEPAGMTEKFMPDIKSIAKIMTYYYSRLGMLNEEDSLELAFPPMYNGNRIWCGSNFVINYRGEVKSCTFLPDIYGNINDERLTSIYPENQEYLLKQDLHNKVKEKCDNCSFKPICRGCRANALGLAGDVFAGDPLCWFNQQ